MVSPSPPTRGNCRFPPPYESINEAPRREILNRTERVTGKREAMLLQVGDVFCLHKMATFASASFASRPCQADRKFLSHFVSGPMSRVVIPHRDTRPFPPQPRKIDGREPVRFHRFPPFCHILRQEASGARERNPGRK